MCWLYHDNFWQCQVWNGAEENSDRNANPSVYHTVQKMRTNPSVYQTVQEWRQTQQCTTRCRNQDKSRLTMTKSNSLSACPRREAGMSDVSLPPPPILLNFFQKILYYFSLRDRIFCVAPVWQLGEVSWSVACAACCHMAPVFAVMHLYTILLLLSIPFLYFFLIWYWSIDGMAHDTSVS